MEGRLKEYLLENMFIILCFMLQREQKFRRFSGEKPLAQSSEESESIFLA